jgi:hypothetical protein
MQRAAGATRRACASACLALAVTASAAQPAPGPDRGALLYDTHCVACHDSQVHWRDKRMVTDWESLKAQVRHWQARANLYWSDADVVEVARHLNDRIYRFPQTSQRLTRRASGGPG